MQISDVTKALEGLYPLKHQESYDNCGLIVGNPHWELGGVLTTLDVTLDVLEEAHRKGCNLIVAHHPIVFFGLKKLNGFNYVEQIVMQAIKWDICIYACHTNLDKAQKGVNYMLLSKLGLTYHEFLKPEHDDNHHIGSGMIGFYQEDIEFDKFLGLVKEGLGCGVVKYVPPVSKRVRRIAVCGGAGFPLWKDAIRAKADVFVTSDVTYHQYFDCEQKIGLLDVGHYESESFVKEGLKGIIDKIFQLNIKDEERPRVIVSAVNTNPVKYY